MTFLSDNRADLERIRVPTLVLQCSEDVIAPPAVGEYVQAQVAGRATSSTARTASGPSSPRTAGEAAAGIAEAIESDVVAFQRGSPRDDVAVVVLKVPPGAAPHG